MINYLKNNSNFSFFFSTCWGIRVFFFFFVVVSTTPTSISKDDLQPMLRGQNDFVSTTFWRDYTCISMLFIFCYWRGVSRTKIKRIPKMTVLENSSSLTLNFRSSFLRFSSILLQWCFHTSEILEIINGFGCGVHEPFPWLLGEVACANWKSIGIHSIKPSKEGGPTKS